MFIDTIPVSILNLRRSPAMFIDHAAVTMFVHHNHALDRVHQRSLKIAATALRQRSMCALSINVH